MKIAFVLIGLLFSLNVSIAQDTTPAYLGNAIDLIDLSIFNLHKGSQEEYVARNLNGEDIYNLAHQEKNIWHLSTSFIVSKEIREEKDIWLQFRSNINAASIYVNNRLLFKNGIVTQSKAAVVKGKNLVQHRISRKYLNEGVNSIAITFSNYKDSEGAIVRDLAIGPLTSFQTNSLIMSTAPILFTGIFLFAIFINIGLFFSLQRKKTFLVLAILFFCNSLLVMYEVGYWNGLVPATSFIHSYTLRSVLEYLVYFILLFVLYFEYGLTKKQLGYSILGFIGIYGISYLLPIPKAVALSSAPFALSLFFYVKGIKKSALITFALGIVFIFNFIDDYNLIESFEIIYSHYILTSIIYKLDNLGVILFASIMIFSSAKNIWSKTTALNTAKLKLNRLEYEFLQKRILPHFLVNSLMSLQQLIAKDPDIASEMVEALSEEFHTLAILGKKKLIPIQEEINMCHNHLKIMSIQQRAHYTLTTKGILDDQMIPPAVLHTLVENGITHGYAGNQNAHFELYSEETLLGMQYRLFNDSKTKPNATKKNSGTGFKYIKARLEECYPGRWKLHSQRVEQGWEAIIEIHSKQ